MKDFPRKAGILGQAVLNSLGPKEQDVAASQEYYSRITRDYSIATGESTGDILGDEQPSRLSQISMALTSKLGTTATTVASAVVSASIRVADSVVHAVRSPLEARLSAAENGLHSEHGGNSRMAQVSRERLQRVQRESAIAAGPTGSHDWVQTAFGVSLLPRNLPMISSSSESGTASIAGAGASVPPAALLDLPSAFSVASSDEAALFPGDFVVGGEVREAVREGAPSRIASARIVLEQH